MSVISDKIAEVRTALDAALQRTQDDVAALNAEIVRLQALVDQGTATPADLAALDEVRTLLEALDPTNDTVLP